MSGMVVPDTRYVIPRIIYTPVFVQSVVELQSNWLLSYNPGTRDCLWFDLVSYPPVVLVEQYVSAHLHECHETAR